MIDNRCVLKLAFVVKCRCKVRRGGRRHDVKGSGKYTRRLGLRDSKMPGRVTGGPHGAWTNMEERGEDEDGVGQVRKEGDGEFE